jgi:hypothetical protein
MGEKLMEQVLFKYRGLEPWEHFLDILVNQRLHSATFQSLNDPMEGIFTYSQDKVAPSFIEQMISNKRQLRICSLSKTHNNTVMWSYYATAHKGVVLGVTVNNGVSNVVAVQDVTYARDNVFRGFLGSDAFTEARKVLSKKLSAWKHEKEVRVFSKTDFVPVSLRALYLGCQMPILQKELLRSLMERLCPNVAVHEMCREDLDKAMDPLVWTA